MAVVGIIIGVCAGIFLIMLAVGLCVYFRFRHTGSKPEISYPNSLIQGNAVQSSFNSHARRTMPDYSDESETEDEEEDESDESSEDEIEKIKNKYKQEQQQIHHEQYEIIHEEPQYVKQEKQPTETTVFVPKVNQEDLLRQDTGNDVDLLRRFESAYRNQSSKSAMHRSKESNFQESIII